MTVLEDSSKKQTVLNQIRDSIGKIDKAEKEFSELCEHKNRAIKSGDPQFIKVASFFLKEHKKKLFWLQQYFQKKKMLEHAKYVGTLMEKIDKALNANS